MTYLKELKAEKPIPKYIYLDQNILIYFAQVYYGKSNDLIEELLEKIQELVKEGKVKIVFNLTNVLEAQKVTNDNRLKKFAEFVVLLTNGYAFVPFPYLKIFEIENVVKIELKQALIDIRDRAIGKGVFYLIHDGSPPKLRAKTPEPIPERTQRLVDAKLREHFSTDEQIIQFFLNREKNKEISLTTIQELEAIRLKGYNIKDKKYKQILGIAQFLEKMIAKNLALVCKVYHVHPRILRLSEGIDRISEVFQNMPLLYTYHKLLQGLDENKGHKITPNDLLDINSFCFALPYCDIVVGENYCIALAKRKRIDKIYNTLVFNKGELNKFLDVLKEIK